MIDRSKIYYYISPSGENPVKEFIDALTKIQKAKIFRIFQTYQEYGLNSIVPHTKKITGTLFWEIRILGRDNVRIIYIIKTKTSVLALHGFAKKKQKIPQTELNIALGRYKDWKGRS